MTKIYNNLRRKENKKGKFIAKKQFFRGKYGYKIHFFALFASICLVQTLHFQEFI